MKNGSRKLNRLEILKKHLIEWQRLPDTSKRVLATHVVEACERLGIIEVLAIEGIKFSTHHNAYTQQTQNGQTLSRWLGEYNDSPQEDRLFHVEQAIVAAMPEQIRINYLSDVYNGCGICVTSPLSGEVSFSNIVQAVKKMTKESAEAESSAIDCMANNDIEISAKAIKEIDEAVAALLQTKSAIQTQQQTNKAIN